MAKKIEGYLKLNIPAGGANPVSAGGACVGSARCEYYGIL